jgi:peptide deformylase
MCRAKTALTHQTTAVIYQQISEGQAASVPKDLVDKRDTKPFPVKVFVNPVMTLTTKKTASYREGCLSVQGTYSTLNRPAVGCHGHAAQGTAAGSPAHAAACF